MPHLQVPQIKPKAAFIGSRASLGKGYRPVAAASCVLGHQMMREDHLASPLKVKHKCGSPCPGRPSLPSQWNGTGPESKQDLSPSLPQAQTELVCVMGFSVVLFVCLFGLEPMDTQHGVESREGGKKWRNEGRKGEVGMRCGGAGGRLMRTCDTQTSPWGDEWPAEKLPAKAAQQIYTNFRIRATKTDRCLWSSNRCFFSDHDRILILVNSFRIFQICFTAHTMTGFFVICKTK